MNTFTTLPPHLAHVNERLGIAAHVYYRPSDNFKRSPLDVPHDLALNEVFIESAVKSHIYGLEM